MLKPLPLRIGGRERERPLPLRRREKALVYALERERENEIIDKSNSGKGVDDVTFVVQRESKAFILFLLFPPKL